jgi:hypothetical protein
LARAPKAGPHTLSVDDEPPWVSFRRLELLNLDTRPEGRRVPSRSLSMCILAMVGHLSAIDTEVATGLVDAITEVGIHWCRGAGGWCNYCNQGQQGQSQIRDIHTDVESDITDADVYIILSANVGGQVRLT